jgi:hypothetical protein
LIESDKAVKDSSLVVGNVVVPEVVRVVVDSEVVDWLVKGAGRGTGEEPIVVLSSCSMKKLLLNKGTDAIISLFGG